MSPTPTWSTESPPTRMLWTVVTGFFQQKWCPLALNFTWQNPVGITLKNYMGEKKKKCCCGIIQCIWTEFKRTPRDGGHSHKCPIQFFSAKNNLMDRCEWRKNVSLPYFWSHIESAESWHANSTYKKSRSDVFCCCTDPFDYYFSLCFIASKLTTARRLIGPWYKLRRAKEQLPPHIINISATPPIPHPWHFFCVQYLAPKLCIQAVLLPKDPVVWFCMQCRYGWVMRDLERKNGQT